jgi:hypothetical protein
MYSGVAIAHSLYRIIESSMCTKTELLEVEVTIVCLSIVGFTPPRNGRYRENSVKMLRQDLSFLAKIRRQRRETT